MPSDQKPRPAAPRFAAVAREERLADKVAGALRESILDGTLPLGERLPSERSLCEQFEVSRPVVREAVRSLIAQGLLAEHPRRGHVIAQPAPPTSASSGGASGSTGSTDTTTVAAASVRIISASGGCAQRPAVFDGGGRGNFSGGPSGAPSDRPSDLPSGGPGRQVSFGAVGKVTALAAHGFTVQAVVPSGSGGSPTTRSVSVTTTAATTYTTTRKTTASAVKVGRCLSAQGSTDSIGGVTATRVQLTQPVDGQCGFRIFRGGPGGPGTGAGGTTAGNA